MVPRDIPWVPGVPPGQGHASQISSPWFSGHPDRPLSPCDSHFHGGFFPYCGQLQSLVDLIIAQEWDTKMKRNVIMVIEKNYHRICMAKCRFSMCCVCPMSKKVQKWPLS